MHRRSRNMDIGPEEVFRFVRRANAVRKTEALRLTEIQEPRVPSIGLARRLYKPGANSMYCAPFV